MINKSIVHYRDDIDLQNLIDFGQKEVRIPLMFSLNNYYLKIVFFVLLVPLLWR